MLRMPLGFWPENLGSAIHHAARNLSGHVDSHSLCGASQLIKNQIGKRTIPSGKHMFERGQCVTTKPCVTTEQGWVLEGFCDGGLGYTRQS